MGGGKGGGGSAPQAPDPYESADAQLNANVIAGMITNGMGRTDVTNPYYSVVNKNLGDGRWQQNIVLSPEQQFLLDQQNALSANMNAQAGDTLSNLGTGRYEDAVYQNYASRLDPQWATQQSNLENQLANQGITRGSAAWSSAMDQMGRSRNDAYAQARNQSVLTGLQARNQLVNEALALSGRGVPQTASAPQSSSPSIQAPDIQGAMQNQYNAQMQQWQQQQQNANNTMNGLFGLGSAAAMAWLSDRRLKTDIRRIGETEAGIPLYEFRYRAGGPPQIGVMAQDVERVIPAAVAEIDGWKHVDYRMVA
ncbi:tail fiber domain-containing protein [Inquilinus limosus]|uniref:tail fiber domain-containing protein n=1 Tax=Inquilinus limosus TaxID=171674 RepID=UPI000691B713|nr:tail fiber domain-containing protein [Inquilinus limosus]